MVIGHPAQICHCTAPGPLSHSCKLSHKSQSCFLSTACNSARIIAFLSAITAAAVSCQAARTSRQPDHLTSGLWQVNQQEWSYGYGPTGSGVYCCQPKQNPMYNYRESVTLGITHLSAQEVSSQLPQLCPARPHDSMVCHENVGSLSWWATRKESQFYFA